MREQAIELRLNLHLIKQSIKWLVYVLLLVNFYFYIMEDIHRATHSLDPDAPLIKWMQEYSASIDYLAWIVLIGIFELDTYILEEHHFTPALERVTQLVRVVCYLFVIHTIYAYSVDLYENYYEVDEAVGVSSLCELTDDEISFVSNLRYTYVTEDNCRTLSRASRYFLLDQGMVVTDRENLQEERLLGWMDLIEVCCWLVIMILIELSIMIQNRGISKGLLINTSNYLKLVLYTTISGMGVYWAFNGHILYFWDELLWIGGFAAIEMNVVDWREELREESGNP